MRTSQPPLGLLPLTMSGCVSPRACPDTGSSGPPSRSTPGTCPSCPPWSSLSRTGRGSSACSSAAPSSPRSRPAEARGRQYQGGTRAVVTASAQQPGGSDGCSEGCRVPCLLLPYGCGKGLAHNRSVSERLRVVGSGGRARSDWCRSQPSSCAPSKDYTTYHQQEQHTHTHKGVYVHGVPAPLDA